MPNKVRAKWRRPFNWPPSEWEFTPGMQKASEVVTGLLFLLVLSTIVGAIFLWPLLLFRTITNVLFGSPDEIRNTLLAVGALIGVPFLIWRTIIAAKQTDISRESHYTALFTKAVEQLGADKVVKRRQLKPPLNAETTVADNIKKEGVQEYDSYEVTERNYEVRLGAIYALERIAQDSKRDAWPINLTLCSYVANNAPPKIETLEELEKYNTSDIIEIFQVLCRYNGPRDDDSVALFQSISLPKMSLFDGALKSMVFVDCVVFDLNLIKSTILIEFRSSDIKFLKINGLANILNLNSCKINQISFVSADVSKLSFVDSVVTSIHLVESKFVNSKISADWTIANIFDSQFDDVQFDAKYDAFSYNKRVKLNKSIFKNCVFSNISFVNMIIKDCYFVNCSFYNCNIVDLKISDDGNNTFTDCFDDDALKEMDSQGVADMYTLLNLWQKFRKGKENHSPFELNGY